MINNKQQEQASRLPSDIESMEHPTLKVPYEILNKKYRVCQKNIDREVNHLNHSVKELKNSTSLSNVNKALDLVVENLKLVKRKADDSILEEQEAAQVCKRRLDNLQGMLDCNSVNLNVWKRKRIDRLLADHLLRGGYYESANKLSQHSDLKNLTNIDLFMVAKEVEDSLASADTSKCLAWCHDNKSKLRKVKSTLEFQLRQQEFIELIKQGNKMDAIVHARKYLGTADELHRKDLEHVMGLLAQPADTQKEPYRSLLDSDRWQTLIDHFKEENYKLYQSNSVSVFSVVLQAGLSALKTPQCYRRSCGQKNPECPVCSTPLNELAKTLPYPHSSQSRLICAITGEPLNEHNSANMLPNGYIYGELGLKEMAARNNGKIKCPKTQQEFNYKDLKRVFIM